MSADNGLSPAPGVDPHIVVPPQRKGNGHARPMVQSGNRKPADDGSVQPSTSYRWHSGLDYGVVLNPLQYTLLGCSASGKSSHSRLGIQVNPLLMPLTQHDMSQESIVWNVLFDTNYAYLATRRSSRSWNDVCDEPATFPRLSCLQICSPCFPWIVSVSNKFGVTCGDILDELHAFLDGTVEPAEFEAFPQSFKTSISATYDINRRTARGRRFYGPEIRRGDVLLSFTAWRGLVYSEQYVTQQVGKPPGVTLVVLLNPSAHNHDSPHASDPSLATSYANSMARSRELLDDHQLQYSSYAHPAPVHAAAQNELPDTPESVMAGSVVSTPKSLDLDSNPRARPNATRALVGVSPPLMLMHPSIENPTGPSTDSCEARSDGSMCLLCHILSHGKREADLELIDLGKWHQSIETFIDNLVLSGGRVSIAYATALQECITECSLEIDDIPVRLRLLQDICAKSFQFPRPYHITDVERGKRIAAGGEATVYAGVFRGQAVVIREFHPPEGGDWESPAGRSIHKLVIRESIAHWQLRHKNIVVFKGLYQSVEEADPPAMVLLRAKHSSAMKYLQEQSNPSIFLRAILDIAEGLAYLHCRTPPVIHGDLHPGNLVVDANGTVQLCDFGLSRIRYEITRTHTDIRSGGRLRFLAPELTAGSETFRIDEASDVYSLAMTIYALGTQGVPFKELPNEWAAAQAAQLGERPVIPSSIGGLDLPTTAKLRGVMTKMWDHESALRPATSVVQSDIQAISTHSL